MAAGQEIRLQPRILRHPERCGYLSSDPCPLPFPLGDDVITEIPDGKNIGDTVLDDPISFTVTLEEWTDAGVTETPEVPVP